MALKLDEQIIIDEQRNYTVVKANEIIQKARYDLNITELKTLAYIFSKIKPTDTKLDEYTFSIKEYCKVSGIDYKNGGNYRYIKETLKGLRDKSFWVLDENGNDVLIGWLQKVKLSKGSGKVTVRLDDDLQKYIIGLFSNYTQYELLSTLPMKSSYSFRIYELLKSYAFQKQHTFYIDELKNQLLAANYVNFKDFRRYVLEVATKEINLYTDIEVSWMPIYKGRKVIQVKFTIKQRNSWGRLKTATRATETLEKQDNKLIKQKEREQ